MLTYTCEQCGKVFSITISPGPKHPRHFCSQKCMGISYRGENHPGYKGGKIKTSEGYVGLLTSQKTPNGRTKYLREHVVLAEKALGKPLPKNAVVHHVDGNRSNNTPGNLVICENDAYHQLLHARQRRIRDTGSFDHKRCTLCERVKALSEFSVDRGRWDKRYPYCKPCDKRKKQEQRAT